MYLFEVTEEFEVSALSQSIDGFEFSICIEWSRDEAKGQSNQIGCPFSVQGCSLLQKSY